MQCDVIDTLVEIELANGCCGRDLAHLAWRSLMLSIDVSNENLLPEHEGCWNVVI